MPEYAYVATSGSGIIERGRIVGAAPGDARQRLTRLGKRLISLQEVTSTGGTVDRLIAVVAGFHFRSIRQVDVELVFQQLAVMLGSGLELAPSLRELALHSPKRRVQHLCGVLAQSVEQGESFERALSHSNAFPLVATRLVAVGESTGELPVMLRRAAEFLENRRLARGNLIAALAYPVLVAIAACSVAAYLVGWAIPKLALFLHALGRKLPAMTQSLVDASAVVQQYGPRILVVFASLAVAMVMMYLWKPGRYHLDRWLLQVPLVGPLMQMAETQQLAGSLAIMLRSGVFLSDALNTAGSLHRNHYLAAQVTRAPAGLARGNDLAGALGRVGFAPMLPSMIAVGERTGELPKALEHVAQFYAGQLDRKLRRMAKLIEPAIIVLVGGIVGYVYIAFFMALLSAGGNFK